MFGGLHPRKVRTIASASSDGCICATGAFAQIYFFSAFRLHLSLIFQRLTTKKLDFIFSISAFFWRIKRFRTFCRSRCQLFIYNRTLASEPNNFIVVRFRSGIEKFTLQKAGTVKINVTLATKTPFKNSYRKCECTVRDMGWTPCLQVFQGIGASLLLAHRRNIPRAADAISMSLPSYA
jgi:hypothetical protein